MGFRVRPLLGERHVPGRTDEGAELPVGENLVDHSAVWLGLKLKPEMRNRTMTDRHTNCCVRYSSKLAGAGPNDMFMASMNILGFDEAGQGRKRRA